MRAIREVFVLAALLPLLCPAASVGSALRRCVLPGQPAAEVKSPVAEASPRGATRVQDEWPEVMQAGPDGGGPLMDGWQLLITSSKDRFGLDEPIDLTVHFKNLSPDAREVGWWQGYPWYNNYVTLSVTSGSGAAIARELDSNERRPGAVNSHNGSVHVFTVAHGTELRLALADLKKFYSLPSGDAYSITATWKTAKRDGGGIAAVTSNTIRAQVYKPIGAAGFR